MWVMGTIGNPYADVQINAHLRYSVSADGDTYNEEKVEETLLDAGKDEEKISYYDINNIDIENCTFDEFCKVVKFARQSYTGFNFKDSFLESLKPDYANGDDKYNFIHILNGDKDKAAKCGNMVLFNEMQIVYNAAASMRNILDKGDNVRVSSDGLLVDNLFSQNFNGMVGSYVLDSFGTADGYTLSAEYYGTSTEENPIVAVRVTKGSDEIVDVHVVNIKDINIHNASLMDVFAYMSYKESLDDDDWQLWTNKTDSSFEQLVNSGVFGEFIDLDDMTSQNYDIPKNVESAKVSILDYEKPDSDTKISDMIEQLRQTYIEKCLKTYEDILKLMECDFGDN